MNYAYENLPNAEFDAAFDRSFAMIILGYMAFMFLIGLVLWILRSRSLHKIAGRRGIRHAWLAWIPVGTEWVLGSAADQYQHLVRGRVTSRRKIILVLALVSFAMYIAAMAIGLLTIFAVIPEQVILTVDALLGILGWAAAVAAVVFHHICNYSLYRSCDPQTAVVFLVLGIIFPVCEPFFYLSCRNKDLGMVVPEPAAPAAPVELPKANPEF